MQKWLVKLIMGRQMFKAHAAFLWLMTYFLWLWLKQWDRDLWEYGM